MAPKNVDDIYPLSPMQRLMLLHEVSTPDRGTLANQICHRIRGPLRADPLRRAFGQLAARHPALRTCVLWEGLDEPLQVVRSAVEVSFETVDLRDVPPAERKVRAEAIRRDDEARGHTLGRAPLMRATLVQLEDERHLLIWNLHHLVADRWSFSRLVSDLGRLYGAEVAGQPAGLERSRGFRDYVAWLKTREPTETDRYWRAALSGLGAPTLLAPALEGGAPRHTSLATLPASATSGLERIAAAARVSTATVVMASLGLATAGRTGKTDVVIGLTVAGRPPDLPGVEDIVGSFVNNVPARFRIDRTTTLSTWLRSIQVEQVRRLPHEHASLARIHDLSPLPGDQPLFDLLTVLNLDRPERATLGDLDLEAVRATLEGGYPLILQVARGDDDLRLTLVHSGPKAVGEALLADSACP